VLEICKIRGETDGLPDLLMVTLNRLCWLTFQHLCRVSEKIGI
jgi:hypothetical protein